MVNLQTIIGEVQTIKTGRKINLEVQTNLPITMEIKTKMETIKVQTATRMPPVGTAKTLVIFKPDVSKELQTENLLSPSREKLLTLSSGDASRCVGNGLFPRTSLRKMIHSLH